MILKEFLLRIRHIDPYKIVRIGVRNDGGWRYWYNLTNMEFVENVLGTVFMECNVIDAYAGYEDEICILVDDHVIRCHTKLVMTKNEFEKHYSLPHLASSMEDTPISDYVKELIESKIDKEFLLRHL